MVEGVVNGQALGLGSSQQSAIATDESEHQFVNSQNPAVAQSDSQLHSVVGFEGMSSRQACSGEEVIRASVDKLVT